MNQTVEDIKAARDIIKDHWYQGGLYDGNGNYCAIGALNQVIANRPYLNYSDDVDWLIRWSSASAALRENLPSEFDEIPMFNDSDTTSREDVLMLFDKTLADLGGLGD